MPPCSLRHRNDRVAVAETSISCGSSGHALHRSPTSQMKKSLAVSDPTTNMRRVINGGALTISKAIAAASRLFKNAFNKCG